MKPSSTSRLSNIAVDVVVFTILEAQLKVLLIKRGVEPYRNCWALPGGFVRKTESIAEAAERELREESGLREVYLEQLFTFGEVQRDPRRRIISVAYYALVDSTSHQLKATTDAQDANWFRWGKLPTVAFDHDQILTMAHERLQAKVKYRPVGFELLPHKFTLTQLQAVYEVILDRNLDKRNFRKKIVSTGVLEPLKEKQANVAHRAAQLFRFDRQSYRRLEQQGFDITFS